MAADSDSDMTFALPDLSGLSEAERLQVIAVMQRAKVGVSSVIRHIVFPYKTTGFTFCFQDRSPQT